MVAVSHNIAREIDNIANARFSVPILQLVWRNGNVEQPRPIIHNVDDCSGIRLEFPAANNDTDNTINVHLSPCGILHIPPGAHLALRNSSGGVPSSSVSLGVMVAAHKSAIHKIRVTRRADMGARAGPLGSAAPVRRNITRIGIGMRIGALWLCTSRSDPGPPEPPLSYHSAQYVRNLCRVFTGPSEIGTRRYRAS